MHNKLILAASEPSGPDTLISRLTADGADAKAALDDFAGRLRLIRWLTTARSPVPNSSGKRFSGRRIASKTSARPNFSKTQPKTLKTQMQPPH
jgi:hypothetical protein